MSSITNLNTVALAIRDFDVARPEERDVSYVVLLDLATPLAMELEQMREKYCHKLEALVRAGDKLTIWWVRGSNLHGEFCSEFVVVNPAEDIPGLVEKYLTEESFQLAGESLEGMTGAAAIVTRNAQKENRNVVGYVFIDGFAHPSVYAGMLTIARLIGPEAQNFYVGEYSGEAGCSEAYTAFSSVLGGRCIYSRDQLDEDTSFEASIAAAARYPSRILNVQKMVPEDAYGFMVFMMGSRVLVAHIDEQNLTKLPVGSTQFAYFADDETTAEQDFYPQLTYSPLLWAAVGVAPFVDEDLDVASMLEAIGDVYLLHMFYYGCESEDMSRFEMACLEAASNSNCRYKQGMLPEVVERSALTPEEIEQRYANTAGEGGVTPFSAHFGPSEMHFLTVLFVSLMVLVVLGLALYMG